MKRTLTFTLILILLLTLTYPASAAGFSLDQGNITGDYLDNTLLKTFFGTLTISTDFSDQQQKYILSGKSQVQSLTYEYPDGSDLYVGTDTGNGSINGEYDPLTGGFYGTMHYEAKFSGAVGTSTLTATVSYVDCEFTGIANPDDTSVKLTFVGKDLNKGKDVAFTVTFSFQGTVPFTQESSEEPEEDEETQLEPSETAKLPDSGTRFSDMTGQVEMLIPTGYDANGEPLYDEEAWQFAKMDATLPEGTRIKTSDRSSAMLSFADMTTFVMKPETEIMLSKPEGGPGHFRLVTGYLWVNFKHVIKTGDFPFEGSQAVAGIKGTTFVLEDDGTETTLKVIEGTVEFTSKATGDSLTVKGGSLLSANQSGLSNITDFDVDAEMEQWQMYGANMPKESFPLGVVLTIIGVVLLATVIFFVVLSINKKKAVSAAASQKPVPQGQAQNQQFCSQCGAPLMPGAAFCARCGWKRNI